MIRGFAATCARYENAYTECWQLTQIQLSISKEI